MTIRSRFILTFFAGILLFSSCDEQRRVITPIVPEGDRIILLEEFTGKGCSNCPKGSRELENLLSIFDENLVVVSIHAGFFADPEFFDIGTYDLRTQEGEALFDYLGPNSGYPAGVVNRLYFNNEIQLGASAWSAAVSDALASEPLVEFTLEKDYNPTTRLLTVKISGIAKGRIEGDLRASVMLTESNIVDAQDDVEAGGVVEDYVHNHVLRDMLTNFSGESFSDLLNTGELFTLSYSGTIDENWDVNQMEAIAFISNITDGGSTFEVLQAGEIHVVD